MASQLAGLKTPECCLFVSRVRLMECLLPDRRVCICSVPHSRDSPLRTPLRGHGLGGETLIQYTLDLKQDCSTSLTLPQAI
jgi:hypothetical protein